MGPQDRKEWKKKERKHKIRGKSNLWKTENSFILKCTFIWKKDSKQHASLFLAAKNSLPWPNCYRRWTVTSKLKYLKFKTKANLHSFERCKQMGQIIISKASLQREKQIWNPKSDELEIKSKATKRNKQVLKLIPPPSAYVVPEPPFLPSFLSHPRQGQAECFGDCPFPRWHQVHKSQTPRECRNLTEGQLSPAWILK